MYYIQEEFKLFSKFYADKKKELDWLSTYMRLNLVPRITATILDDEELQDEIGRLKDELRIAIGDLDELVAKIDEI